MENTLKYNSELCVGCGMCVNVCPHAVFIIEDHKAKIINRDDCIECGACQLNCPVDAITVDSGAGCASAMIRAVLTGSKEPFCGCGSGSTIC